MTDLHPLNTASDKAFDLAAAPWTDVSIHDIAWGLSQINRFYGSTCRPYSVAEHSLLVHQIARQELRLDVHGQMAALMHDAHEIYCNDLHPTTKRLLGPAWTQLEAMYESAVRTAFGLHTAFGVHAEAIRLADQMALAAELEQLKGGQVAKWGRSNGIPVTQIDVRHFSRAQMTWDLWRDLFLSTFKQLDAERSPATF